MTVVCWMSAPSQPMSMPSVLPTAGLMIETPSTSTLLQGEPKARVMAPVIVSVTPRKEMLCTLGREPRILRCKPRQVGTVPSDCRGLE